MVDVAIVIEALLGFGVKYGGCLEFGLEKEFDDLRWNDVRIKPTWAEILTKWDEIKDLPEPKTEMELLQEKVDDIEARLVIQENK